MSVSFMKILKIYFAIMKKWGNRTRGNGKIKQGKYTCLVMTYLNNKNK